MKQLRKPDDTDGGGTANDKKGQGTSADVIANGGKTAEETRLQNELKNRDKRIADLEQEKGGLMQQIADLTNFAEAARQAPSRTGGNRSVWDDLNDFIEGKSA